MLLSAGNLLTTALFMLYSWSGWERDGVWELQRGCHNFDSTFLHLGLEFVCEDMSFVSPLFSVLFLCSPRPSWPCSAVYSIIFFWEQYDLANIKKKDSSGMVGRTGSIPLK